LENLADGKSRKELLRIWPFSESLDWAFQRPLLPSDFALLVFF
jgi:hypothetical protein